MKISYQWLKDFIDINHSPQELSVFLTDVGLEVESLEKVESIKKRDIKNDNINNDIAYNQEHEEENDLWVMIIWKIINKHNSMVDDNDKIFIKKTFKDYTNNFKLSHINKKKYKRYCN